MFKKQKDILRKLKNQICNVEAIVEALHELWQKSPTIEKCDYCKQLAFVKDLQLEHQVNHSMNKKNLTFYLATETMFECPVVYYHPACYLKALGKEICKSCGGAGTTTIKESKNGRTEKK